MPGCPSQQQLLTPATPSHDPNGGRQFCAGGRRLAVFPRYCGVMSWNLGNSSGGPPDHSRREQTNVG